MDILPAAPHMAPAIAQLLDEGFGADRRQRTAYRLREGSAPAPGLSFVILDGGAIAASIEFWPILVGGVEALLLGPVAVAETHRNKGLGGQIIRHGLAAAKRRGHKLIVLVGDPEYYSRFGFSAAATRFWQMPGPVEARRLLALPLVKKLALPCEAAIRSNPLPHPGEAEEGEEAGEGERGRQQGFAG